MTVDQVRMLQWRKQHIRLLGLATDRTPYQKTRQVFMGTVKRKETK